MTGADRLTCSRLLLGPLAFTLLALAAATGAPPPSGAARGLLLAALAVTVAGDLTDLFDGVIARRTGGGTDFGKLADPFTDSVFRLSVYLGLVSLARFPAWGFLLLLLRDLSNAFLRQMAALHGHALASRWSGKVKAGVQAIGAYLLMLDILVPWSPPGFRAGGCAFIALYTFGSGLDYLWANRSVLTRART